LDEETLAHLDAQPASANGRADRQRRTGGPQGASIGEWLVVALDADLILA
jgi:hypothetical protein